MCLYKKNATFDFYVIVNQLDHMNTAQYNILRLGDYGRWIGSSLTQVKVFSTFYLSLNVKSNATFTGLDTANMVTSWSLQWSAFQNNTHTVSYESLLWSQSHE